MDQAPTLPKIFPPKIDLCAKKGQDSMRIKAKYITRLFGLLFIVSVVKLSSRRFNNDDSEAVELDWSRVTPANNIKNEFYDNLLASDKEHLFQKKPKENPFLSAIIKRYKTWQQRLKDWHDYELLEHEAARRGKGEHGKACNLSAEEQNSTRYNELYRANGYNALLSERISLKRNVADLRHVACKSRLYLEDLPTVSVIIPFQNEHLLTLMRSVHSIVDRAPAELLKEVILVDDKSDKEELQEPMNEYINVNFRNGKVKVLRLPKREGLIRTRLAGAKIALGEVLVFFDSHIECGINWLPPLIEPIAYDRKTVVCPIVDIIDAQTFEIRPQGGIRGAFDWYLNYKRLPGIPDDSRRPTDPYNDPIMSGGLFAINRDWFYELGAYDEAFEFWGGEQYELSFKVWQCGGTLVDAPCSRVGHIYKDFNPISISTEIAFLAYNYKRVAEVWMDDFKEFAYAPDYNFRFYKVGDLSKQHKLRASLGCKSFRWFMETIAFDFKDHFKHKYPEMLGEGEFYNQGTGLCIDFSGRGVGSKVALRKCASRNNLTSDDQYLYLSYLNEIRAASRDVCLDNEPDSGNELFLRKCHGYHGNQEFHYDLDTLQLIHRMSGMCVVADEFALAIEIGMCNSRSSYQKWEIQYTRREHLLNAFKADAYSPRLVKRPKPRQA